VSSEPVVHARGLGQRFDLYAKPADRFIELLGGRSRATPVWAVRGVDLDVMPGETVGIVGRNGSGKSTLLQMICGTLSPTEGEVRVRGRVAALLELGAGFNPEFSGMENIYLNAALMGLDRRETDAHLDAILAFADIGDYVHRPVRTYSSGMYVRLAFSVAVAVEPDLLVVDEALAVGDEAFQRKCFARIEALKERGSAILFVSHAASAVVQLCDRAVLMEAGTKWLEGPPRSVMAHYQRVLYGPAERRDELMDELRAPAPARLDEGLRVESTLHYESRGARIEAPRLVDDSGSEVNVLLPGGLYRYVYAVHFDAAADQVHFGMLVKATNGTELFGMASHAHGEGIEHVAAGAVVRVEFQFRAAMLPGTYYLNAGCVGVLPGEGETYLHRIIDALAFRIDETRTRRRVSGFFDISEEPACTVSFEENR